METGIFRKNVLDKVSSPEQLDAYLRTASPSAWFFLLAILLVLIGGCIWGAFLPRETTSQFSVQSQQNKIYSDGLADAAPGMMIRIDGEEYEILEVNEIPLTGQTTWCADLGVELMDGIYQAVLVEERITPLSFLLN